MREMKERCSELASPDIANFTISLFILVGILGSYIPQHLRIITRRSSEGLSPYFILLGTTSVTCAVANILVLPISRTDVGCCKDISSFACAAALLGIAQVGVQWSSFFLIMLLFLIFFPKRGNDGRPADAATAHGMEPGAQSWQKAVFAVTVALSHLFAVMMISMILLAAFPKYLQIWANILGLMATILSAIQYVPQLWVTWHLQEVKSLSIPMMCIQTPGGFVFAASLAVRLGVEGWSAWTVYLVTATLQGVLLAMCISFELRDRKLRRENGSVQNTDASSGTAVLDTTSSERTPLLVS